MKYLNALLFIFLNAACGNISACFSISYPSSNEELVIRTSTIVLAKVTDIQILETGDYVRDAINFFTPIETIKGSVARTFSLTFPSMPINNKTMYNTDFNEHKDKEFWVDRSVGRGDSLPSCDQYAVFEKGKIYLLFLNRFFFKKSFELIESDNDKWFEYVRSFYRK